MLETQPQPLTLLLTMDLYDDQGTRIGHIRRNALSAHSAGRYIIDVRPVARQTRTTLLQSPWQTEQLDARCSKPVSCREEKFASLWATSIPIKGN